jgi:hypothetical protein
MSFFRKLFGLGEAKVREPEPAPSQEHKGFTILATPFQAQGRWQLCGILQLESEGEIKEHKFIRADAFGSEEEAIEMTFFKGRQIIDQQGEAILKAPHG